MKLLCIDGNSVLNRAFYAIKVLTTKDGRYTNAIYGFMNMLNKLLADYSPEAVAVAFDLRGPTFRHKMYDGYKASRKGMPQELAEQLPELKELLTALGYSIVTSEGFEADDILGTLSASCEKSGVKCYLATGDRDSLQLIGANTQVLLTTTKFGRGELAEMDEKKFSDDYGFAPKFLVDLKALMGDSSDNIPGVAGVGEKTATALLLRFGSLDGVYENLDSPDIKDSVRARLISNKDMAYLSYKLATIVKDVPIETDAKKYVPVQGDPKRACEILEELEMHSLVAKLGLEKACEEKESKSKNESAKPVLAQIEQLDSSDIPDKMYLFFGEGGYYAAAGNRAYKLEKESLKAVLLSGCEKYCAETKPLFHAALDFGIVAVNVRFDVSLAAYLLNPSASGYELEKLAAQYRVTPMFECEIKQLALLEPLCKALERELAKTGMDELLYKMEQPLAIVLAQMEHSGFGVDAKGIGEFGGELSKMIADEQKIIYEQAGYEFNVNSPKQLGEALFVKLGLPLGKKTKSGFSTDAETLEKLRFDHEIIEHVLNYRTYQKLVSTYVDGLLKTVDPQGRIHTDFKQTETRTGRISSTNPNLQNIPVRTELGSRLRKYFVAGDGKVLLDADYSQIELRVLAHISGDEHMIEAFLNNRDIHTETASQIFKLPRNMITPELRRRAKAVNFGIVYGIGAFSLSHDVGVSMTEAADYIKGYLDTYSSVREYLENTVENAKADGYVTTMYGRRRMLPELANSNKGVQALGKRLAMNTPIQGTAADIIKLAMIRVSDRLKREKLDARLILQVHDELIVECSLADADKAAKALKEEMEGAADLKAPLVAEVGRGKSWYEAK
ncbi:MAG: DNA polymerase I [Oscillospiraceae bacterium]